MKLTLGVEPFNGESHTSENMLRMVLQLLEYYNLLSKTNVGLRDNASAMKAMFNLSIFDELISMNSKFYESSFVMADNERWKER